jgi:hypothetical protein
MKSRQMDMNSKDPHTVLWIFGIVFTAFAAVSIAAFNGWIA